jgi:mutator protein MutT
VPGQQRQVLCAGAVVRDADGRLLLVRRGHAPSAGLWSLPGGRVEPGETAAEAAAREVREETGLIVEVGPLLGRTELAGPAGSTYLVDDFSCTPVGGRLAAGSDASDVRWVSADELLRLACTPRLVETLVDWGAVPR